MCDSKVAAGVLLLKTTFVSQVTPINRHHNMFLEMHTFVTLFPQVSQEPPTMTLTVDMVLQSEPTQALTLAHLFPILTHLIMTEVALEPTVAHHPHL